MKGVVATGAVSGAGLGAMYYGYGTPSDMPSRLRVGIIGTGDEGNVLIGAITPEYIDVVHICDIRPYNIHRAFYGDWASPAAHAARTGLMEKYGWATETEARKHVKVSETTDTTKADYKEVLENPDVEAVIIALPLHLHHEVAMAAMAAGKHVLTEKLMAHNVMQCKEMGRMSAEKKLLMATGHQRHYSVLYDNAVNLLQWGLLGELQYIRAQWHRGNLPGRDSWAQPIPGGITVGNKVVDDIGKKLAALRAKLSKLEGGSRVDPDEITRTRAQVAQWAAWVNDKNVVAEDYDYESIKLPNGRNRSALEELVRWRLWNRTGGGLMAELGSHQLDAASIFVSAMNGDGKKVHPLSVHATGGRHTFPLDRDADDHVYCMFDFPAPGYEPSKDTKKYGYYDELNNYPDPAKGIPSHEQDSNKKITVTYASTMGNGFGGYGETVMGSKGTLILEREQEVMLFKDSATSSKIRVKKGAGGPTMDTQASGGPAAPVAKAAASGPVSRGYTEEMEHFAWCIKNPAKENQPKCSPDVALADAVIALTTKLAINRANAGKGGFIPFNPEWFDIDSDSTPEAEFGV
jgi:predicted dehydrogenase